MNNCPICYDELEVRDALPCFVCGCWHQGEDLEKKVNESDVSIYGLVDNTEIILCHLCYLEDVLSGRGDLLEHLNIRKEESAAGVRFFDHAEAKIIKDKYCTTCEKRLALIKLKAQTHCVKDLPMGARPVVQIHPKAKILIAGQAPGIRVHKSGVPFDDPSGDRLRAWLGIDKDTFYDAKQIAILPMGFCYPGTGKSGDLPPRKECAEKWREPLLSILKNIDLTLVIGQYALKWHIYKNGGDTKKKTLTATVQDWESYWPDQLPLPHPSPRNNIWLKKNPWFEKDLIPVLQKRVKKLLK